MTYLFGDFELDPARVELRKSGVAIAIEPQVFALLKCLIDHRDRVLRKDELIELVWNRRVISDAAVASRIKSARQALGDDGRTQRYIRTAHGCGFRFVAEVTHVHSSASVPSAAQTSSGNENSTPTEGSGRPGIAVLPFRLLGDAGAYYVVAQALPQDLITELSKLRWLLVIARGSSFRFSSSNFNLDEVRISLNVRYCLSGVIEAFNKQASITVELSDTHDRGIIWSERFTSKIDATHEIRKQIVRAVINALDIRIPLVEAQRAQLKSPDNLDAWSAFHLGLHHMYQFNKSNNATAADYFRRAVSMDKGFARAYAGLSFTHFQDAFLHYSEPTEAAKLARQYAEQCLEWDPVEPFGNFAMGRSCWLIGNLERSLPWLERATALNPNYAQATYSRGWAEALLGNTEKSLKNIDDAQALSPLDPFLYGMLGVRAISHIVSQDYLRAAEWATRAAQAPGAHALIDMIAAVAHALNGDDEMARQWASSARVRAPELTRHDFLRSFPFREGASRARIEAMLKRHGF